MSILRQNPAIVTDVRARAVEHVMARGQEFCHKRTRFKAGAVDEHGVLLSAEYCVQGANNEEGKYMVRYDARRNNATCTCNAGRDDYACWHQGVVLLIVWAWSQR